MTNARANRRRRRAEADARHGIAEPFGQEEPGHDRPKTHIGLLVGWPDTPGGRFGRMLDLDPCPVSDDAIDELTGLMKQRGADDVTGNPRITAGFTYLAQFIDHDITFDPVSSLERDIELPEMRNFRTPRLDLDSLYGAGNAVHPFLYDWDADPPGTKLLVGRNAIGRGLAREDLPRNQQGRALIGDARNDEHVIIAQLHLLFIRFHNAVVDHLCRKGTPHRTQRQRDELSRQAQQTVRWHYQWIVAHEFLRLIVGDRVWEDVLDRVTKDKPPGPNDKRLKWRSPPFIPVEFSGAAYRFGHSMVRALYVVRPATEGPLSIFPDLRGFRWLPESLVVDWNVFFGPKVEPGTPYSTPPEHRDLQFGAPIDTAIAGPLFELPEGGDALPQRNLKRGRRLKLPSGQAVANAMKENALDQGELKLDECGQKVQRQLVDATPLWYYILCEAARDPCLGAHLGPVGGRIVAQALLHLLLWDEFSYLRQQPRWKPTLGAIQGDKVPDNDRFTMADLIRIAQKGVDG